jgi:chromosome segregation ATPase
LNGDAFKQQSKFKTVQLEFNICINEDFNTVARIAVLKEKVNDKCGFVEPTMEGMHGDDKDLEESQSTCNQTEQNEELKSEILEVKFELKALKKEWKSDKDQCNQQLIFIKELQQKLESHWNSTCVAETEELRINFQYKVQENGELNRRLQQKEAEVVNYKRDIEKLKKTIEDLERSKNDS